MASEHSNAGVEGPLTRTGVLRFEFGRFWPFWLWLRHQFSPTSLGVIGALLGGASMYITHLNGRVSSQEVKVMVLETRVVPIIEEKSRVALLEGEFKGMQSMVSTSFVDHEARLKRIESNFDLDYNERMREEREQRAQRKRK